MGSRVLVTGASGSVGRLAVQLARHGGAHVIASVEAAERARGLDAEIAVGLDGVEPVDVVIEVLGGPHLVAAWRLLKPGGNLQSIGWAAEQPAVFPPNSTFALGRARSLSSFGDVAAPAADLAFLVGLVARGELSTTIGWRGSWDRLDEAASAHLARDVQGKVVIDIAG